MKLGDLVKSLMPESFHNGNGQVGIIIEAIEGVAPLTMYHVRWRDVGMGLHFGCWRGR